MAIDLLVLAGDASEHLEQRGLIACGRREQGRTRIEFSTRAGKGYRYDLTDDHATLEGVVAACLAIAGLPTEPAFPQRGSSLPS
jgi:hypothetical protein